MKEITRKKIRITDTTLRDAHQSLWATRMRTADMLEIASEIDSAGYYSLECWGGATFDVCMRFLRENPWERLRQIKAVCKNTPLQMLLRGQNLLGYKHYPDDVVRRFVQLSVENGIDIIRIFDALNDTRNIKVAVEETIKCGAHASGAISYTTSPVHTLAKYVELSKEMKEMGVNSICIKDMAGVMAPDEAYALVSAIKEAVDLPLIVHTHCTTGLAFMTYLKAVEAGADVIDTASSCFSGGTSQPATETLMYALKNLGYDVSVDAGIAKEVNDFFKPVRDEFLASGKLNPKVLATDTDALNYKIPGGMLSNLIAQLTAQNALDKLPEVLEETPRVREDMGYPPLVTPLSQMVGVQAATNVLVGERYKNISKEIKAYLRGEYGRAPGEINAELMAKGLEGETPVTCRFADLLEPQFEAAKAEIGDLAKSDEDVLSYIAFPQQAEKFLTDRLAAEENKATYTIEAI